MIDRGEALEALRREVSGRKFGFATVLEVTDGGASGFLVQEVAGATFDEVGWYGASLTDQP